MRKYLDHPPTEDDIRGGVLAALSKAPIEMMRTGETVFKELGLNRDSDEATLIAAMVAHPILIERPIVIRDDTARIGRPPESVLELF